MDKKVNVFIFFFIVTATASTHAQTKTEAKTVAEVLMCARNIIENKSLTLKENPALGAENAASFIDQAASNPNKALADCKKFDSVDSIPLNYVRISNVQLALAITQSPKISMSAKNILLNFLLPKADCQKLGANASASILAGLAAKLDVAKCVGTNGKRWIEIIPGAGVTFGLGAIASVSWGNYQYETSSSYINATLSMSSYGTAALILGVHLGDQGEVVTIPGYEEGDNGTNNGIAAGLGAMLGVTYDAQLALIPLGTSKEKLAEIFYQQYKLVNDSAKSILRP